MCHFISLVVSSCCCRLHPPSCRLGTRSKTATTIPPQNPLPRSITAWSLQYEGHTHAQAPALRLPPCFVRTLRRTLLTSMAGPAAAHPTNPGCRLLSAARPVLLPAPQPASQQLLCSNNNMTPGGESRQLLTRHPHHLRPCCCRCRRRAGNTHSHAGTDTSAQG